MLGLQNSEPPRCLTITYCDRSETGAGRGGGRKNLALNLWVDDSKQFDRSSYELATAQLMIRGRRGSHAPQDNWGLARREAGRSRGGGPIRNELEEILA